MKHKKILSCALAAMMAMQSSGVVFAGEQKTTYSINQLQEANYSSLLDYMLNNGYLKTDEHNNLLVTEKYKAYVENQLKATNENLDVYDVYVDKNIIGLRNKANEDIGETKFEWTWKGFDIYLDHNVCDSVVKAASASAAITTIIAKFMPAAISVAETIDAIVGLGIFIFESQDLGRGIIIAFLYEQGIVGPIPHWVSSQ